MNAIVFVSPVGRWGCLLLALLALCFAGCATHRIDWPARIGQYTFDQAVLDFGPPDKQAKLTDGTVVAEWLTQRGYTQIRVMGAYGYPCWGYGPGYPALLNDRGPDYYLRLTFGPDGRLTAWKNFAK